MADIDPTETLNFLYQRPLENWLDYYVDKNKLGQLVLGNARESQRDLILTLLDQFSEQALLAQRDHDMVLMKEMDPEDIVYSKKKLARIWMNAASCFAALHWDLDTVFEKLNINHMVGMMSYLLYETFPDRSERVSAFDHVLDIDVRNLTGERLFLAWLFIIWIFKVDRMCRFQQPMAKATVSNPLAQIDPGLVQAERMMETSREFQKFMPRAMNLLKRLIANDLSADIVVPDVPCFFNPMKDVLPQAEMLMPGESVVDNEPVMKPDYSMGHFNVEARQFLMKSHFEILRAHMSVGHYKKSEELCKQLIGDLTAVAAPECPPTKKIKMEDPLTKIGALFWVDPDEFRGYCEATGVAPVISSEQPAALQKLSQPTLLAVTNCGKPGYEDYLLADRLAIELHMGDSSSDLQIKYACESIVVSLRKGDPVDMKFVLFVVANKHAEVQLATALLREILQPNQRDTNVKTLIAFVYFVCGISASATFADVIEKARETCSIVKHRRPFDIRQPKREKPIPSRKEIAALQKSDFLLWRVFTTFEYAEIKELVSSDKKFHTPQRFKMPDMLYECIMNSSALAGTNCEHISVYLGKLEQLAGMNIEEWEKRINDFATDLSTVVQDKITLNRVVYEAVRVKIEFYNKTLHRQGYNISADSAVVALTKAGTVDPPPPLQKFMSSICAFLINTCQWDALMKMMDVSKFKTPTLDMARVLAACLIVRHPPAAPGTAPPPVNPAQVAATANDWWKFIMLTFERIGRHDSKTNIGIRQFESLLENIKEPRAITFLLNFFAKLYNHMLLNQKEPKRSLLPDEMEEQQKQPQKQIPADPPGLRRIFAENLDAFPQSINGVINEKNVDSALNIIFANAMLTNSSNGFWLRSYGDYKFSKGAYREAMLFYLEALVSISDGLLNAFSENVVDDVMWMKMIKCCQQCQFPTLSAMITQMMKEPGAHYPYAHQILKETTPCNDAAGAYFPLVADTILGEYMSDAYFTSGQYVKADLLSKALSDQAMNQNNHPLIIRCESARRKIKFLRVLCSHFFDLHDLHTVS